MMLGRWDDAFPPSLAECAGSILHRVVGVLSRVVGVLHRVVAVLHRVVRVLHRVVGVLHRVVGRGGALQTDNRVTPGHAVRKGVLLGKPEEQGRTGWARHQAVRPAPHFQGHFPHP